MFDDISPAPPDSILGLTEAFKSDPRPFKVNLGVGVFQNDNGQTPVLRAVKAAEAAILSAETTKNYLPIPGEPEFGQRVEEFLFGDARPAAARTAQAPGGTGALRIAADLLAEISSMSAVWLSAPTWPNHRGVFGAPGLAIKSYPYYDTAGRRVTFDAFADTLEKIPAGDIVVLHLGCHNPSGADPTLEQWKAVAGIAARRGWLPVFDAAYIGFGDSVEEDRRPLRVFLESGIELLIATSFSKNLGLYRERAGALTLVARSPAAADAAFSRVKRVIRVLFSNPPSHGGQIARLVLSDPILRTMWIEELKTMCGRIHAMRDRFAEEMARRAPDRDFSFIRAQRGMFSFSGLSPAHVVWLRAERAIFMTEDGRINVAGLTPKNLDYVCAAIADALGAVAA